MSARFNVSMLMLNTALAGALAVMWVGPLSQRVWSVPPAQPSNLDEVASSVLLDNPALAESYPVVIERPLLSASRKAPPPPAPPDAPAAPPPTVVLDQVKLSGIVQSAGVLWVLAEVEGKPRSLKQGDTVGDWRLASVSDRSVSFAKGSETHELKLPHVHTPAPGTTDEVLSLRPPAPPPPPKAKPQPKPRAQPESAEGPSADSEPKAANGELPGVSFGAPPRRQRPES